MRNLIIPIMVKPISLVKKIFENREFLYALKHQRDGLRFTGDIYLEHCRRGKCLHAAWEPTHNILPTEGLTWLVNVLFHDITKPSIPATGVPSSVTPTSVFYVYLFKGNVTPVAGDTAAARLGAGGTYQECQDADYDEPLTNRPSWVTADSTDGVITNEASKAHFVFAAGLTVYGAGLTTTAAKTDVSGKLVTGKRFDNPRPVISDDEIDVTYQITATSA